MRHNRISNKHQIVIYDRVLSHTTQRKMFHILKIKHHIHRTSTKEYIGKILNGLEMRKKNLT